MSPFRALFATLLASWLVVPSPSLSGEGTTFPNIRLVSTNAAGAPADLGNIRPYVSNNGRWLVFVSAASNLVPGIPGGVTQVYRKDLTTGEVAHVTRSIDGTFANKNSNNPIVSEDGRLVIFESDANNLVPNDTNDPQGLPDIGGTDIFVRDMDAQETKRLSVDSMGTEFSEPSRLFSVSGSFDRVVFNSREAVTAEDANDLNDAFSKEIDTGNLSQISTNGVSVIADLGASVSGITDDGTRALLVSSSTNLVGNATNGIPEFYEKNLVDESVRRLLFQSSGAPIDTIDFGIGIDYTADGTYFAYSVRNANLVSGETSGVNQIFRTNTASLESQLVSVSFDGGNVNEQSSSPSMSDDGQLVVFRSLASNLVPDDTNGEADIFLRNMQTGITTRLSIGLENNQANAASFSPYLSGNGRYVVFESDASNLTTTASLGVRQIYLVDLGSEARRPQAVPMLGSASVFLLIACLLFGALLRSLHTE